jgi:pyruvate/2-oxoglutarate dehydrogenase complex dihydrolipoamide dehydrogenase (E3) component
LLGNGFIYGEFVAVGVRIDETHSSGEVWVERAHSYLRGTMRHGRNLETRQSMLRDFTRMWIKLLVSTDDLKLLGVHIFGTNATELVHIGQAVMGCGGTIEYLVDAVFNYPTFAGAYKVAALDVMNKIRTLNQFRT